MLGVGGIVYIFSSLHFKLCFQFLSPIIEANILKNRLSPSFVYTTCDLKAYANLPTEFHTEFHFKT